MLLSIAVLAGGESRRMGKNKALLDFHGVPLIVRILERVSVIADEVVIITNQPEDFAFLPFRLAQDVIPGKGALGGLYSALFTARNASVGVVACDMPFVSSDLLQHELNLLKSKKVDLVIPRLEVGYEPLHAVYHKDTCLPAIQNALDEGQRRMVSWLPAVKVFELNREAISAIAPPDLTFININTPDDFGKASGHSRSRNDI